MNNEPSRAVLPSEQIIEKACNIRYKSRKNPVAFLSKELNISIEEAQKLANRLPTKASWLDRHFSLLPESAARPVRTINPATPAPVLDLTIEATPNVSWNQLTAQYNVMLHKSNRRKIMDHSDHILLMMRYTGALNNPDDSLEQMTTNFKFVDKGELIEYAEANGWNRNSPQYCTHHEITTLDQLKLKDLLRNRKEKMLQAKLEEQVRQLEWKTVTEAATMWQEAEKNIYSPMIRILGDYKDMPYKEMMEDWLKKNPQQIELNGRPYDKSIGTDEALIVTLSDIHFGAKANEAELIYGEDYNFAVITKILDDYMKFIVARNRARKKPLTKVWLFMLGDLLHGLNGETVKGTELHVECEGYGQYKGAFVLLRKFISELAEEFDEVHVAAVKGNHAGDNDLILCHAVIQSLKNQYPRLVYLSDDARDVKWILTHDDVLFVIGHGASSEYKAKTPAPTMRTQRENYLTKVSTAIGTKTTAKYVYHIQGDLHRYSRFDFGIAEDIVLPSTVLGDAYADANNLTSRPGQKVFVVGNEGILEEWTYYVKTKS